MVSPSARKSVLVRGECRCQRIANPVHLIGCQVELCEDIGAYISRLAEFDATCQRHIKNTGQCGLNGLRSKTSHCQKALPTGGITRSKLCFRAKFNACSRSALNCGLFLSIRVSA
ncbi:hypothetical protein EH63_25945 [Escherichia coli]|nr:hypothetical protein EH63_25945 [Escherichia coli]